MKLTKSKKIFLLLSLIAIFAIIYSLINYTPYWDEGVYISNGKFLFSGGHISTYEYQRPPMIALVTGLTWFLGLNVIIFSKLILIIIFLLGLFYLYKISEDIIPDSGFLAILLFSSLYYILFFLNRVLTGIAGLSISIIGYYLYTKKKYFLSGLILSIAFLFRYTTGMVFLVIGIFMLIELIKKKTLNKLYNLLKYIGGFLVLTLPFIVINYIAYYFPGPFLKRLFTPFISASTMVAANAYDLTHSGFIYYFKFLITQNLVILLIIIFLILLITKKNLRKNKYILPTTIAVAYYIYLSTIVHFEPRYILVSMPFFAIISAITIKEILRKIKKVNLRNTIYTIIIILLIIEFIFSAYSAFNTTNKQSTNLNLKRYYSYFNNKDVNMVGIDNPLFGIYNNSYKVFYLAGPAYINKRINEHKGKFQYIAYSERNFTCWNKKDLDCNKEVNKFKNTLKNYNLVYTFYFQDSNHFIYKVN